MAEPAGSRARSLPYSKTLRIVGALVCCLFALQAGWIFANWPGLSNPWAICHWFGQALLCVFAGAAGCFLEVKGARAVFQARMATFRVNRIIMGVFYFWLGCFIVDIANYDPVQNTIARVTGVLSWVLSIGNFVILCLRARTVGEDDLERNLLRAQGTRASSARGSDEPEPAATRPPSTRAAAKADASQWSQASSFVHPADLEQPVAQTDSSSPFDEDAGPSATAAPTSAPAGGWNTAATQAFGSA